MSFTDEDRRLGGRIGGLIKASRHPPAELTAPARAGLARKFLDEVDADRTLPDGERNRRALAAKKAFFTRLSLKAVQAKKRKAAERSAAAARAAGGAP